MNNIQKAQIKLLKLYKDFGYIVFDDIAETASDFDIDDIDLLSTFLESRGISIYESDESAEEHGEIVLWEDDKDRIDAFQDYVVRKAMQNNNQISFEEIRNIASKYEIELDSSLFNQVLESISGQNLNGCRMEAQPQTRQNTSEGPNPASPPRLDVKHLRSLCTFYSTFRKGEYYASEGRVKELIPSADGKLIKALVMGSTEYNVSIHVSNGIITQHECNCPAHRKYKGPCKHVIAAALVYAHSNSNPEQFANKEDAPKPTANERQKNEPDHSLLDYDGSMQYINGRLYYGFFKQHSKLLPLEWLIVFTGEPQNGQVEADLLSTRTLYVINEVKLDRDHPTVAKEQLQLAFSSILHGCFPNKTPLSQSVSYGTDQQIGLMFKASCAFDRNLPSTFVVKDYPFSGVEDICPNYLVCDDPDHYVVDSKGMIRPVVMGEKVGVRPEIKVKISKEILKEIEGTTFEYDLDKSFIFSDLREAAFGGVFPLTEVSNEEYPGYAEEETQEFKKRLGACLGIFDGSLEMYCYGPFGNVEPWKYFPKKIEWVRACSKRNNQDSQVYITRLAIMFLQNVGEDIKNVNSFLSLFEKCCLPNDKSLFAQTDGRYVFLPTEEEITSLKELGGLSPFAEELYLRFSGDDEEYPDIFRDLCIYETQNRDSPYGLVDGFYGQKKDLQPQSSAFIHVCIRIKTID